MNIKQIQKLKNIMTHFESDYHLAEQVCARHEELDQAIPITALNKVFETLLGPRFDVRRDVLEAAMDDIEFQTLAVDMINSLTGFVARYDIADQIDSAKDAA